MNDLTTCRSGEAPATAEDVARFLLIPPEKTAAMRAEIRAIQDENLLKAVYDLLLEEQRLLRGITLALYERINELTREATVDTL